MSYVFHVGPRWWWHGWRFSVWCSAQPGCRILCDSSSLALLLPPYTNAINWISTHIRVWTEPVKSADQLVLHVIQVITLCVNTKFSLLGPYWCSRLMIWLECALTDWLCVQTTLRYYPRKQQERKCFMKMDEKEESWENHYLSAVTFACR